MSEPLLVRLHVNAFALALEEADHAARANGDVTAALVEAVGSVARLNREDLLLQMCRAVMGSVRMVMPGVLPSPQEGASVQISMSLLLANGTRISSDDYHPGPGPDPLRPAKVGTQLFGALGTGDTAQQEALLRAAMTADEHGEALAYTLMLVGLLLRQHAPQAPHERSGGELRCPGCRALLGDTHDYSCPQARCSRSGQPWELCRDVAAGCSRTVWEGLPTGFREAMRRGWWCVQEGGQGRPCGPEEEGARPDVERLRRECAWQERLQTWD